jgi:hypothetical protein
MKLARLCIQFLPILFFGSVLFAQEGDEKYAVELQDTLFRQTKTFDNLNAWGITVPLNSEVNTSYFNELSLGIVFEHYSINQFSYSSNFNIQKVESLSFFNFMPIGNFDFQLHGTFPLIELNSKSKDRSVLLKNTTNIDTNYSIRATFLFLKSLKVRIGLDREFFKSQTFNKEISSALNQIYDSDNQFYQANYQGKVGISLHRDANHQSKTRINAKDYRFKKDSYSYLYGDIILGFLPLTQNIRSYEHPFFPDTTTFPIISINPKNYLPFKVLGFETGYHLKLNLINSFFIQFNTCIGINPGYFDSHKVIDRMYFKAGMNLSYVRRKYNHSLF